MTATLIEPPVSFTANAITELKRIREAENLSEDQLLRVGVKGGGCSGMSYVLDFDRQQASDELFEVDGLRMLMDKRHAIYLLGMHIEFNDGLNSRGFVFRNPNATSTCGCGQSFSA